MIRDAQRARLRELVLMLEDIEPGFCFDTDATMIADAAPGSLVLLGLQREQLDWLNLNRPLFAERSLRVVLWAEGDLAVDLKFCAPDLHDWISHFVTCPPGVPEFAVEELAQRIQSRPGVAWIGPHLELALPLVGLCDCIKLDPSQDYSQIIETIESSRPNCIIWKNAQTFSQIWRVRLATAETGFTGTSILDNPASTTAEWHVINANQLGLRDAAASIPGRDKHRAAALAELNPRAIAPTRTVSGDSNDNKITSSIYRTIEEIVRSGAGDRALAVHGIAWLGQRDIAAHWETRWSIRGKDTKNYARFFQSASWQPLILFVRGQAARGTANLPKFLERIRAAAERRFGLADPEYLFVSRVLGLAAGIYADPEVAQRYLALPAEAAEHDQSPLLGGADLEHSVVRTMLGRYEAALAQLERATTTDPDYENFERFHQLTRAGLGQVRLEGADETPLSTRIQTEARRLLTNRLDRLANP